MSGERNRRGAPAGRPRNDDRGDPRQPFPGHSTRRAQIVEFTRALLRKHRVDDAAFKAMQSRFGNDQLIS